MNLTFQPKDRLGSAVLACESNKTEDEMGRVEVEELEPRVGGKVSEGCNSELKPSLLEHRQ